MRSNPLREKRIATAREGEKGGTGRLARLRLGTEEKKKRGNFDESVLLSSSSASAAERGKLKSRDTLSRNRPTEGREKKETSAIILLIFVRRRAPWGAEGEKKNEEEKREIGKRT